MIAEGKNKKERQNYVARLYFFYAQRLNYVSRYLLVFLTLFFILGFSLLWTIIIIDDAREEMYL